MHLCPLPPLPPLAKMAETFRLKIWQAQPCQNTRQHTLHCPSNTRPPKGHLGTAMRPLQESQSHARGVSQLKGEALHCQPGKPQCRTARNTKINIWCPNLKHQESSHGYHSTSSNTLGHTCTKRSGIHPRLQEKKAAGPVGRGKIPEMGYAQAGPSSPLQLPAMNSHTFS